MEIEDKIKRLQQELNDAEKLIQERRDLKGALEQEIWLLKEEISKAQRLKKG